MIDTFVIYCSSDTSIIYCSSNTLVVYYSGNTLVIYCSSELVKRTLNEDDEMRDYVSERTLEFQAIHAFTHPRIHASAHPRILKLQADADRDELIWGPKARWISMIQVGRDGSQHRHYRVIVTHIC